MLTLLVYIFTTTQYLWLYIPTWQWLERVTDALSLEVGARCALESVEELRRRTQENVGHLVTNENFDGDMAVSLEWASS